MIDMTNDTVLLRPQPLGIYPLPAGYLVLPALAEPVERVMRGDATALPAAWRFFGLALDGDLDGALAQLAGADIDPDIADYNRFVLRSDLQVYAHLRLTLRGELRKLLDVVAFTLGYINELPSADDSDGEIAALILAAHATRQIEADAPQQAIRLLERAVDLTRAASPLFAAQLLSQIASLRRGTPGQVAAQAIKHYQDALQLAGDTPMQSLRAELWLNLGMTFHELSNGQRGALLEAVKAYQAAIQTGVSLERGAELYAMAHNNLALAYLSMPMVEASDQLRMGVAVQSLREALKVYTRETHLELWASAQLNLANALQYLPSSHPQDNLVQAVEIYEQLLQVRNKAYDPLGYARLLANQANALAHLGIFAPALEKLTEAHKLFHWHGEPELAASALNLVEEINQRLGEG